MPTTSKTAALPFTMLLLVACHKDKAYWPTDEKHDIQLFRMQTNSQFRGELDGKDFSWDYGINAMATAYGYENANGFCDSTDPSRILFSEYTIVRPTAVKFEISTPMYFSNVESQVRNILSNGIKKLGDKHTSFCFRITIDGNTYITSSSNPNNKLEILQTQPFVSQWGGKLTRVWFRISANLIPYNSSESDTHTVSGLLLVNFWGLRYGD